VRAKKAMDAVLGSEWGRLFQHWENAVPNEHGYPDVGTVPHKLHKSGWSAFARSLGILGTCVKEAPEFGRRRMRRAAPM
jgi:hypothetical protein